MTIQERIAALRSVMKREGVDACYVPTSDFHGSEYVGEYFKCRKYITGFTGSAGTAVITQESAGLWTDGRYFLQAEDQLAGTGVTLYKMGEEGVPTVPEFLENAMKSGQVLGFDGRTVSASLGQSLERLLTKKGASVRCDLDLVGEIWADRPALSCRPVWLLDTAFAGKTRVEKLADMRSELAKKQADHLLLTSLDDIAWLLNVRGDDVACNPVVLSYMDLTQEKAVWYVQEAAINDAVRSQLEQDGVTIAPYDRFYQDTAGNIAAAAKDGQAPLRIWADLGRINYTLLRILDKARVLNLQNPTLLPKAVKNPVEVENIRLAHIKDGVAMVRFIHWLKTRVGQEEITELSAAVKLEELRGMDPAYMGPSFDPIIGYADHAAIIHYSATKETDVRMQPKGMVLADTGGQYPEGTTDITRTVVLGETSREEKEYFTRVLRGNLNLAGAKFREGASGLALDYLAREPLWQIGEDYNHGTGHGVGFCLNVHEGPNSFHWKQYPGRRAETVLEEGMLTSDEPGYYRAGAFGIRHENLMLCVKAEKTEYGQFMEFDTVTLVPFDLDGVLPEMMTDREIALLNAYHQKVWEKISLYLEGEELAWLKDATRKIG